VLSHSGCFGTYFGTPEQGTSMGIGSGLLVGDIQVAGRRCPQTPSEHRNKGAGAVIPNLESNRRYVAAAGQQFQLHAAVAAVVAISEMTCLFAQGKVG
jgi:hypothetical protein